MNEVNMNKDTSKGIIFFDWDDTLFPHSFLLSRGIFPRSIDIPSDIQQGLNMLERSLSTFLTVAIESVPTCIVTNAESGWVFYSASNFMPGLIPILKKIPILSARSTYERCYPNSPLLWKQEAYRYLLTNEHSPLRIPMKEKYVVSFGDGIERDALKIVVDSMESTYVKSVQFVSFPTIPQLIKQLEVLRPCIAPLLNYPTSLHLDFTTTLSDSNILSDKDIKDIEQYNDDNSTTMKIEYVAA